ncbi:MAG: tetratricopeptide repeat protein, partial [Bacteroidetes bacterium]|nr:tetratricopeptide repeat protein [Bacteroidota bacterium]
AWQKVGWLQFIKGDTSGYRQAMTKVISAGSASGEEDKQALHEAQSKQLPNLIMLRARLLFDGGYYDKAAAELLNRSTKTFLFSKKDLVEYSYRLGRIYHESGNPVKALGYYRITIQRGKNEPWYFAAASALQMGFIYENNGEPAKADSAYHVCLECKPAEYKNSLSQKAKAGINRIRQNHP